MCTKLSISNNSDIATLLKHNNWNTCSSRKLRRIYLKCNVHRMKAECEDDGALLRRFVITHGESTQVLKYCTVLVGRRCWLPGDRPLIDSATTRHGDDVVHRSHRKYLSRYLHLQITLGLLRLLKLIITIHEIARSTRWRE